MKNKIALLICALLLLTGVFAACSNSVTTKSVRWEDNETYTFNITLSDFAEDGYQFNSHEVPVIKEDGSQSALICYKDLGTTQEAVLFQSYDEIRPVDAKGTFTMSIVFDSSTTRRLETTQEIYSQYNTETLEALGCLNALSAYIVTGESNPFENNEGRTTLLSKTTSTVIFSNDAEQLPVSSEKVNKGYYIGKKYQGVSDYSYKTTYDFDNLKVSVSKDGGEAVEKKLGLSKGGTCIDAGQILLYTRSWDKSSSAFGNTPSVSVYDPVADSLATATFSLEREFNALLNNDGKDYAASVNALYVAVSGRPLLAEFNLPDLTEKNLDFLPATGAGKTCKYTTIKFRSGWYSYELNEYNADVLSAIGLKK